MSLHKIRALILQSYETGDTSEVVRTFSAEFGRLSVMAKGARNPKRRMAGLLQPLSTLEMTLHTREGAEMGTLRDVSPDNARESLRTDLERWALGSLLAEVAAASCETHHESHEMFAVLEAGLAALDPSAGQPAPTGAVHYLLRILTVAGYEPNIDPALLAPWPKDASRPRMFWLDVSEGRIHAEGDQPPREPAWPLSVPDETRVVPLPPEAVRALYENQRTETLDLARLPRLDSDRANAFIDARSRLARWHLGHPIRAAKFWRSIIS